MPVWIFDLDNTLHDASRAIFPRINAEMTAYLKTHLELDEQAANALRQDYWQRYGATLLGLIKHHQTDPQHFLQSTHPFPALAELLVKPARLRSALRQLPGRRVVYSNAPRHYVEIITRRLGIADLLDDLVAIETVGYRPKPQRLSFIRALRAIGEPAEACVMVEDSEENLLTAKRLGMRTVWISDARKQPPWVDLKIRNVMALPRLAATWR